MWPISLSMATTEMTIDRMLPGLDGIAIGA